MISAKTLTDFASDCDNQGKRLIEVLPVCFKNIRVIEKFNDKSLMKYTIKNTLKECVNKNKR